MKDIFKNNRIIVFALSLTALIISSLIGVTYAFYSYNAINSNAVSGGSDYECSQQVTYTKGQDIAGTLTMGTDYTSGEYVEVKMNVASGCSTLLGTLYLNTREESTMNYSDQALRYTVLVDGSVVSEGAVTGEEKQIIYTNFPITSTSKTYRIYIWLDASKEDFSIDDIEIYNGFIDADARMQSDIIVYEPTPYTDFTYYLSTDTSSETIYLEDFYGGCSSDSCVDISSSITGTRFNNSTNYIVLFDYIGTNETVRVPDTYTIDGTVYDVYIVSEAKLGDGSSNGIFYENDLIENVDIVNDVSLVNYYSSFANGSNATSLFLNCTNLVTVSNLPSSITGMWDTFSGCTSLVNAPAIPNSVTEMTYTFKNCTSLVNAPVIPSSVTDMYGTFRGCTNLVNAPVIPNSVTSMIHTFNNCTSLVNAPVISNSVTNMSYTFYNCTSLVNAPVIPDSVTNMNSTFSLCTSLVNAPAIPDSVTNMSSTFSNCTSLVNAPVISDSVTNMDSTFSSCTSLVNAPVIPDSVTNMNSTFSSCRSLVNAPVIPDSVTSMNKTFYSCSNLTGTVTVNSSNVSSATNTFASIGSSNLITLNVPTGSTTYTTFSNSSLPSNVTLTPFTP